MRLDALDISHHNTVTNVAAIPDVPYGIWHKVNEGRAIDRMIKTRILWLKELPIWGGYTVLLPAFPGRSTVRQQIEQYVDIMGPHWREGVGTQLDVEPWGGRYERPPSADEIDEAIFIHTELLGRPPAVYINPNEMPREFSEWRNRNPRHPFWMPNYSNNGSVAAVRLRADVHQYTSTAKVSGFQSGIDANEVLNPEAINLICGIKPVVIPEPPVPPVIVPPVTPPVKDTDMILWNPAGYADAFLIGGTPPMRISPATFTALTDRGVPFVSQDADKRMLHDVLVAADITESELEVL